MHDRQFAAFFTQALLVWDAELRQADMDEFLNVACVGVEKALSEIARAFEELFIQAMDNYYDILGASFMLANLAWKDVGDEYTPWDLVQQVVRLTMSGFTPPQPDDPPITVYDPCGGSGAFLLGVLEYVDTRYPEVLDRGQVKLYGQELTRVGWLMCRVNLRLHHLARHLRRPWAYQQQTSAQAASQAETQAEAGEVAQEAITPSRLPRVQAPTVIPLEQEMRATLLASISTRQAGKSSRTERKIASESPEASPS